MHGSSWSRPLPPFLLPDPDDDVLLLQKHDDHQQHQQQQWQQQCALAAVREGVSFYQVRRREGGKGVTLKEGRRMKSKSVFNWS